MTEFVANDRTAKECERMKKDTHTLAGMLWKCTECICQGQNVMRIPEPAIAENI